MPRTEGPRPRRPHKFKQPTVKIVDPQPGDSEPPIRDWGPELRSLMMLPAIRRGKAYAAVDPGFWHWVRAQADELTAISAKTGISSETVRKYFTEHGIAWSSERLTHRDREAAALKLITDAYIEELGNRLHYGYDPLVITPNEAYAWISDVHVPWISRLWVGRAIRVCRVMGIKNLNLLGDFYNLDTLSKFALTDRETMPSFKEEMEAGRHVQDEFNEQFTGKKRTVLTNHEMRLYKIARGEVPSSLIGDWLFGMDKIVVAPEKAERTKETEVDHLIVGNAADEVGALRGIHPDRGQLISFNQADGFALQTMQHCLVAHNHEFFTGYARNGMRIVGLGGLFGPQRYSYRRTSKKRTSNGFAVSIPSNSGQTILAFGEGFTDWSKFGAK